MPCDLINNDLRKLTCFCTIDYCILCKRQQARSIAVGYDRFYEGTGDTTLLAYVEILADGQQITALFFLSRAAAMLNLKCVACFHQISDHGWAYFSKALPKTCPNLVLRHMITSP